MINRLPRLQQGVAVVCCTSALQFVCCSMLQYICYGVTTISGSLDCHIVLQWCVLVVCCSSVLQ